MKCIIVGARGFIGGHLGRLCAGEGHEVVALEADVVADPIEVPAGTDAVFYLAQASGRGPFPDGAGALVAVNTAGAVRCAEAAHAAGAKVFCYASTGTVYAPSFAPMAEEHPVRRDDPYALSKVAAEEALALVPGPMQVVCARLFGVFGPGQRPETLVAAIARRVREGRPVRLDPNPGDPGDDGGLRISLTFVEDVARCLLAIAGCAAAGGPVPSPLNVAAPEAVSLRALAGNAARLCGAEAVFERSTEPRASDYVADVGRLCALIAPRFAPLADALATVVPAGLAARG